ncbi:MAG: hypothetical protein ACE5IM_10075, partial [Nitrospinota bacterium]
MTAIRVLTGPFHPDLEESLRAHLEAWSRPGEKGRPLPAFALVAPSQEMRRHLKRLITLRWGMTLAGAHLLTAYHLSRRIVRASDGPPPPADDLILEGLIRELVLAGDFPAEWKGIVRTAGGAGALHRTLRDLEEARVPAAGGRGDPILRLHARYQKARRERGFGTHTDPVEAAIGLSAESAFLRSLDHVAYYGFYDMTQVQLDLLERVSSVSPTTFFLPCVPGHRAYGFAEDFLEVLRGRFPEADVRPATDGEGQERKGGAPPGGPSPVLRSALDRIFRDEPGDRGAAAAAAAAEAAAKLESYTASGPEAELEIAAKRILRWTEEEGFRFDEMGVVARRLSPYLPFLAAVFDAHAVPFRTPEAQPVSRLPWA